MFKKDFRFYDFPYEIKLNRILKVRKFQLPKCQLLFHKVLYNIGNKTYPYTPEISILKGKI